MTPADEPPAGWRTLREIDHAMGWPKGTAFRAFRTLAAGGGEARASAWREGPHYRLWRRHDDPRIFDQLSSRLYPGSLTAILLSPTMASELGMPA